MTLPESGPWPGLCRIIDANPDPIRIRQHGLGPIAVTHWEETDRPVPATLNGARHAQAVVSLETERLLQLVNAMTEGARILYKGIEVAGCYPDPTLRVSRDVDVLFADAVRAQTAMLAQGWTTKLAPGFDADPSKNDALHQLAPLVWPGVSLPLEVHRAPNWPTWASPPTFAEILEASVPSVTGLSGFVAPSAEHHALMVLAHSWARQPFEQMSQLLDFALVRVRCDDALLRRTARSWDLTRLLDVADRTVEATLYGRGARPVPVRLFASHLETLEVPSSRRQQFNRYGASSLVTSFDGATRAAVQGSCRRTRIIGRRITRWVRGSDASAY